MGHLSAFFEAYYMIYGLAVMNYRSLPSRVQCSSGQHSFWHLIHQQGNCEGELHRFQLRIRPLAIVSCVQLTNHAGIWRTPSVDKEPLCKYYFLHTLHNCIDIPSIIQVSSLSVILVFKYIPDEAQ